MLRPHAILAYKGLTARSVPFSQILPHAEKCLAIGEWLKVQGLYNCKEKCAQNVLSWLSNWHGRKVNKVVFTIQSTVYYWLMEPHTCFNQENGSGERLTR